MAVNINVPSQVKTYANLAAFPATGALKTIYIAEDTNKTYRWTGSVYVEVSASASGITIGSTAIASGTVGRILFEGTGNVVQQSSSLFWDATNNRLGIGTSSPTAPLTIKFTGQTGQDFYISGSGSNTHNIGGGNTLNIVHPNITAGASFGTAYGSVNRYFSIGSSFNLNARLAVLGGGTTSATSSFLVLNNSSTELFRIRDNGNVGINTTTDAGFRLDVNGTARVQGQATIAGTTNASAGLGRNTLINGTITATANNNVLVGLDIEPTFNTGAFTGVETLALRVTGFISNFTSSGATQIRIIGPSNANKSLFFFNSSSTFASTRIYNQGTTNHLVFATGDSLSNPTDRFAIFASTGNVGINTTTDAGFRLDVNGTARVRTTDTSTPLNIAHSGSVGIQIEANANGYRMRLASTSTFSDISTPDSYLTLNQSGQRVVIGSSTIYNSAQLAVDSTTRGFLPPRMTTTQKNAIASPAAGLMVYDTTLNVISYYNGSMWI